MLYLQSLLQDIPPLTKYPTFYSQLQEFQCHLPKLPWILFFYSNHGPWHTTVIGKLPKSRSHLLPKLSNMTMTFDPVNLQDSIPRISCNKGEVHMPEDICFNIHEWTKKKKYWRQLRCSKLGDQLRKLWYLQMVNRIALPRMFIIIVKYYNKHFSH